MSLLARSALTLTLISFALSASAAPIIGQIDTFEDGTTMGWFVPGAHPIPPANVATGGPSGAGDAYLQLTASAALGGAGSRLSVLNADQWTGDFLAAGIGGLRMNVNNFGPDDLYLRLLFEDFEGVGPPANLALTATPVFVPAGSGWTTVVFDISPDALVVETFGTVLGALSDVDTLRIFHNPAPTFPGPGAGIPTVNATLGVDNIEAVAVPEPATLLLIAGGLAGVLRRHRRTVRG
jgi:hypothetical protein